MLRRIELASRGLVVTPNHLDNAKDRKALGLYVMTPMGFLDLTTDRSSTQWAGEERKAGLIHSVQQYNTWAQNGSNTVMPFLYVDQATGKVIGHEGRHRAVALLDEHISEMTVALFLKFQGYSYYKRDGRYLDATDVPELWIGEFRPTRHTFSSSNLTLLWS